MFTSRTKNDRPSKQPTKKEIKTYRKENIQHVIRLFQEKGIVLGPLGKAAEVVRGLYDETNVMQFFVISEESGFVDGVVSTLMKKINLIARDSNSCLIHQVKNSKGFTTPFGIIYFHVETEDNGRKFYLYEDYFDRNGLLPIRLNQLWWSQHGFYDNEMVKDNHFRYVSEFVAEVGGDDHDVRACRALLTFAEYRDQSSYKEFNEKLKLVRDPSPYKPLAADILAVSNL